MKNIENYLSGKDIDIKENNYSFLLSFAFLYKLTHLRTLCEDWKENNIEELSLEISNYIIRKYGIYNEYIMNIYIYIYRKTKWERLLIKPLSAYVDNLLQ